MRRFLFLLPILAGCQFVPAEIVSSGPDQVAVKAGAHMNPGEEARIACAEYGKLPILERTETDERDGGVDYILYYFRCE